MKKTNVKHPINVLWTKSGVLIKEGNVDKEELSKTLDTMIGILAELKMQGKTEVLDKDIDWWLNRVWVRIEAEGLLIE